MLLARIDKAAYQLDTWGTRRGHRHVNIMEKQANIATDERKQKEELSERKRVAREKWNAAFEK